MKFGYLSVGVVEDGPADWLGKTVFCLYPHQDRYVVPVESLTESFRRPSPPAAPCSPARWRPPINGIWEAGPRFGDRVAVIGAGLVGGMVAKLLSAFPLARLQLIDVDPAKRAFAETLGVEFSHPDDALPDCDIVIHCSASEEGLARALQLAGDDGDVIEMSWYADRKVTVPLGEDFHARRLSIRASQVGVVARARRHRRTNADRLQLAVSLLRDPGVRRVPHRRVHPRRAARRRPAALRRHTGRALPRHRIPRHRIRHHRSHEVNPCSA